MHSSGAVYRANVAVRLGSHQILPPECIVFRALRLLHAVVPNRQCALAGSFAGQRRTRQPAVDFQSPQHTAVTLYSNRFFRTFGANRKQKSPAINNLHDLSNHTFTVFSKSIQVVDWDR
jgi:hypothetical protein